MSFIGGITVWEWKMTWKMMEGDQEWSGGGQVRSERPGKPMKPEKNYDFEGIKYVR